MLQQLLSFPGIDLQTLKKHCLIALPFLTLFLPQPTKTEFPPRILTLFFRALCAGFDYLSSLWKGLPGPESCALPLALQPAASPSPSLVLPHPTPYCLLCVLGALGGSIPPTGTDDHSPL